MNARFSFFGVLVVMASSRFLLAYPPSETGAGTIEELFECFNEVQKTSGGGPHALKTDRRETVAAIFDYQGKEKNSVVGIYVYTSSAVYYYALPKTPAFQTPDTDVYHLKLIIPSREKDKGEQNVELTVYTGERHEGRRYPIHADQPSGPGAKYDNWSPIPRKATDRMDERSMELLRSALTNLMDKRVRVETHLLEGHTKFLRRNGRGSLPVQMPNRIVLKALEACSNVKDKVVADAASENLSRLRREYPAFDEATREFWDRLKFPRPRRYPSRRGSH